MRREDRKIYIHLALVKVLEDLCILRAQNMLGNSKNHVPVTWLRSVEKPIMEFEHVYGCNG